MNNSDYRTFEACFITREIIESAALRRVDDVEGSEMIGRTRNASTDYAGIVYPYFLPPDYGTPLEYRLRRDRPDYERNPKGELKQKGRYLAPPGRSNRLYFPPGLTEADLRDTTKPLVITEGEKKTLALRRLSGESGFVPIGLSGVWNWRGSIGKTAAADGKRVDVKGVIADFDYLEMQGRKITILFDANVHSNQGVWAARQNLARELSKRGSHVYFAELPATGGVNGIDDYLGRIESKDGTPAAITAGMQILDAAIPFGDAVPIFTDPPKPLGQILQPVSKVDADLLPDVLKRWLVAAAKSLGCPLDFLAVAAITTAGGLIGSRVRVLPIQNSKWTVVPNLYTGIVGPPSSKKTPALDEVRRPVLRLQTAARDEFAQRQEEYDLESGFYERSKKEAVSKAKSIIEARSRMDLLAKPEKPVRRRFETNDVTSPKMAQFLSENPNGLVLFRDELAGWLHSLDADYDRSSRPFYLELWKGGISYELARVSEGREIFIKSGTLAIVGSIQPSRLQRYVNEAYSSYEADGFVQRFLFAYPDPFDQKSNPTESDLDVLEDGFNAACRVFDRLATNKFNSNARTDNGDEFLGVRFDREAQADFDQWRDANESEAKRCEVVDEPYASFLYKLAKSCAAVTLIFHCIENAYATTFPDRITRSTMTMALAYIDVMTTHARRVFALGENRVFSAAQILLAKIGAGKVENGFTARDLKRKGWSGLSEQIEDALGVLVEYGHLRTINVDSGGRPTAKYYVHPSIKSKNEI